MSCVVFAYHEMGYACLKALLEMNVEVSALFTHSDSADEPIWWRSCASLASTCGIPVYTPESLDSQWTGRIASLRPSIIYSFYYRKLLPAPVLDLPQLGAYNLHGSLLPRYRGRAPVNWAILNGERETGVTLHHMVTRADAGDIVAQRSTPISDSDTAFTLYMRLVEMGAELIREYHPLIAAGRAPRRPQDLSQGSYYGRRTPDDGRIDWSWPARRIFNLVRAVTHPYPGAFCFVSGRKLFVWETRIVDEDGTFGRPGEVLEATHRGGVTVAAGAGRLELLRIGYSCDAQEPGRTLVEVTPPILQLS